MRRETGLLLVLGVAAAAVVGMVSLSTFVADGSAASGAPGPGQDQVPRLTLGDTIAGLGPPGFVLCGLAFVVVIFSFVALVAALRVRGKVLDALREGEGAALAAANRSGYAAAIVARAGALALVVGLGGGAWHVMWRMQRLQEATWGRLSHLDLVPGLRFLSWCVGIGGFVAIGAFALSGLLGGWARGRGARVLAASRSGGEA